MTDPIVFAPLVEGMFVRALGTRLTPACREHLRQRGLDLDVPLRPSYSLEQWKDFLRITAAHLYSGLPAKATYLAMGERLVESQFENFMGRGRLGMLRLMGPSRTLTQAAKLLRQLTNFADLRRVDLGPGAVDFRVNDVLADEPTFMAGCLGRLLTLTHAQGLSVVPHAFDGRACTFELRWSEQPGAALPVEAEKRAQL